MLFEPSFCSSKYPLLCFADQKKSYRFATIWQGSKWWQKDDVNPLVEKKRDRKLNYMSGCLSTGIEKRLTQQKYDFSKSSPMTQLGHIVVL